MSRPGMTIRWRLRPAVPIFTTGLGVRKATGSYFTKAVRG